MTVDGADVRPYPVSYVTLHDLVATLDENIGRYTSMTSLFINLTRLISEDAAVLSDTELDEVSRVCLSVPSRPRSDDALSAGLH